jgi:hypothetical protein
VNHVSESYKWIIQVNHTSKSYSRSAIVDQLTFHESTVQKGSVVLGK